MTSTDDLLHELEGDPRTWLVTGAAGFIGSHLVEELLRRGQRVRGLDDFSTGSRANLEEVRAAVGDEAFERFHLIEGDLRDPEACRRAVAGSERVLHQGALGSVPRSIADPLNTHGANVTGTLNLWRAASEAGVRRLVYASSSSVYGDHPALPKREEVLGRVLSPYAASKRADEIYAEAFGNAYGLSLIGLRYFNVFGPRQDPEGPYAAVIPRWVAALVAGERPVINGDGQTSRDFCPVANVVQANLRAALAPEAAAGRAYNVALGGRTTLEELAARLRELVSAFEPSAAGLDPEYRDFREGDVRHSHADVSAARDALGYDPDVDFVEGLRRTVDWFVQGGGRARFAPALGTGGK